MNQQSKYLILDIIKKTGSLMPLFNSGYSYALIYNWCKELEEEGLIVRGEDGTRLLTKEGKKCWNQLKKNKKIVNIVPLNNVHTEKMSIEDIYIPHW